MKMVTLYTNYILSIAYRQNAPNRVTDRLLPRQAKMVTLYTNYSLSIGYRQNVPNRVTDRLLPRQA